MANIKNARIQLLIDTTSNWQTANPILLKGEIGLEIKANGNIGIKVGNGTTSWNLLAYMSLTPAEITTIQAELQAEIDAIVIGSTAEADAAAEVAQARVNASGATYTTLKARLDTIDGDVKNVNNGTDILYIDKLSMHQSDSGASLTNGVYRKYINYNFKSGVQYRIIFDLKKFTVRPTSNVGMNLRTTKTASTSYLVDNVSGEYSKNKSVSGKYIWYFTPSSDEGKYLYIFLQSADNTTIDYDITIQESANGYIMRGADENLNTSTIDSICLSDLNNLPNNRVYGCSVSDGSLANVPIQTFSGQIFTHGKSANRSNSDTQIFIHKTGVVYSRIYFDNEWKQWIASEDKFVHFISETSALSTDCNKRLANVTDICIFVADVDKWDDIPSGTINGGGVFINQKYSTNYNIQKYTAIKSGNKWERIVNKNGTIYRDWTQVNGLPPLKILALGDSICYGYRNQQKGFVGDLGLPYKNIGVSSATLSNKVTSVKNIPQQLLDETSYNPDIIIAEGGINDYIQGAPLGTVPSEPATTDTEANALNRNTVTGAIGFLFYNMIKKFPKAQRFFVVVHKMKRWNKPEIGNPYYPTTQNDQGYTQQDLHDALVEMCELYNVKVIDVYKDGIINTKFEQYVSDVDYSTNPDVTYTDYVNIDGVHPLDFGYREGYVPLIRQAIGIGTVKEV